MVRTFVFATAAICTIGGIALAGGKLIEFDRARLDDPAYAAILLEEITDAARHDCQDELAVPMYGRSMRSCIEDAVARAVEAIGSETLTALAKAEAAPKRLAAG